MACGVSVLFLAVELKIGLRRFLFEGVFPVVNVLHNSLKLGMHGAFLAKEVLRII